MLDKTLPRIRVVMEKNDVPVYPRFSLPEGYTFSFYRPGMEDDWARIETAVGQFEDEQTAREYFVREFLCDPSLLESRYFFALAPDGTVAGMAALWPGEDFGEQRQRVHWVAVDPAHQGKGIAKALLTRVLALYETCGDQRPLYLITQTWSYQAIGIYMRFGFIPYLGPKPAGWPEDASYREQTTEGWRLILQTLRRHGGMCCPGGACSVCDKA